MKLVYLIFGAVFFAGPLLTAILGGALLYGSIAVRQLPDLEEAKASSDESTIYVVGHGAGFGFGRHTVEVWPHPLPAILILVGSLLVLAGGILLLAGPKIIASSV